MSHIKRWGKIPALGTHETEGIFSDEVTISEKVDGSACNWGNSSDHGLEMLSKGSTFTLGDGKKQFSPAASHITALYDEGRLMENYSYHAETLATVGHNTLVYDRVPLNNLALYAVTKPDGTIIVDQYDLKQIAEELRIEICPIFFQGKIDLSNALEYVQSFLGRESFLGKAKIEGIVIKNNHKSMMYGGMVFPVMQAKYVSEDFKEQHKVAWPVNNQAPLQIIGGMVRTQARWDKARQYVRDCGVDIDTPKAIGPIMKRLHQDFQEEDKETVKNMLWSAFMKDLLRVATRGYPEWHKAKLVKPDLTLTEFDSRGTWSLEEEALKHAEEKAAA